MENMVADEYKEPINAYGLESYTHTVICSHCSEHYCVNMPLSKYKCPTCGEYPIVLKWVGTSSARSSVD